MNQEELNRKFQIFEQQIMQIQEQSRAVEQAILDLTQISTGLETIIGNGDSEVMAPIGRGIFVKAKLLSEDLTVDIGGGNFVTKTIAQTKEMIGEQSEKLNGMKEELDQEMERINTELTKTMQEVQGEEKDHVCCGGKGDCNHEHKDEEHSCACGHEH